MNRPTNRPDPAGITVVIAPDSFKGTADAFDVGQALATGWREHRPGDRIVVLPMADGGEGSATAIASALPGSQHIACAVTGPDGREVDSGWWLLPDGTAVVELAGASGLPLMQTLDPTGSHTTGFGQLLAVAATHPQVQKIVATVGGSASTDGGSGALVALGARLLDAAGEPVTPAGAGLPTIVSVDIAELIPPPPGGVVVLTDVTAPLLGPTGAAAVFGPQKGASPQQVANLDAALVHWARVVGGQPNQPGAGAAGGTAFGLATVWGASLQPGARYIADLIGLPSALAAADVVITGEGRYDEQSATGKVVGFVIDAHRAVQSRNTLGRNASQLFVVAGDVRAEPPIGVGAVSLVTLAGGAIPAMAEPLRWLRRAGADLAAGHLC